MALSTIEWTRYTFNPWRGCTKVSAGCDNCYAEAGSKRNPKVLGVWGNDGVRAMAAEAYWRAPVKWNAEAAAAGRRDRVFCASLADVAEDRPELVAPRRRLCELIEATPSLLWMLLSKRPQNFRRLFPAHILERCMVGTSVEDQPAADTRIRELLETPAFLRFLSCEPLLGPLDLRRYLCGCRSCVRGGTGIGRAGLPASIDLVIVGGESGAGARENRLSWVRGILQQCATVGTAAFNKQVGSNFVDDVGRGAEPLIYIRHKKGGDPEEWPEDIRVREIPAGALGAP